MFGKFFDRIIPQKPIVARTINRAISEVERISQINLTPPIDGYYSSSGTLIRKVEAAELDARITSVGSLGVYGWRGIVPDVTAPGTWIDLDSSISGTTTVDPAYEQNMNASLPTTTRIQMRRKMGQWIFLYDKCS